MNNIIPAVDRTVELLETLTRFPRGATQAELQRTLSVPASTVYRILQTLLARRWVRKTPDGVYFPDAGLLPLCTACRESLGMLDRAQTVIDRLAADYDIACKLSIRRGAEQVTVRRAEPAGPVALTGRNGSSFPVIEGSVGAALLCGETAAAIRALAASCPVDLPEKRDPELILAAVREVRSRGWVLNLRPNRWNIAAMSMPVRDASGSVTAALTLIGTAADFAGKNRTRLAGALERAVRDCEEDTVSETKGVFRT